MTTEEVLELLKSETDRVEFTVSTKDTDKFSQAVCAFANDFPSSGKPGYLIIGADDKGQPIGLTVTDELLRNLSDLRRNGNILPLPAITVTKLILPDNKGELAVVETLTSDTPPVRYKGQVWIRVGPSKSIATEAEERILSEKRTANYKTYDIQPCKGTSIKELVLELFLVTYRPQAVADEIIEENHRSLEEQLAALRFYDLKHNCPTMAGILLFGSRVTNVLPGAYIQYVRFEGSDLDSKVIEERRFVGDLINMLHELDGFIKTQIISYPETDSSLREVQVFDYPVVAIREFLMNSIIHRDYESNTPIRFYSFADHIEIQNSGGLYGTVDESNFRHHNDYRNPVIAESMKNLGYVNRFGVGITRAMSALEKNGNPEPEFSFTSKHTYVKVKKRASHLGVGL